jgi:PTH1 family peptidyl-tRNA hydrolase
MKLIVGLGNPGKEYSGTRHNIGFEVVDAFAARSGWIPSPADFGRLAREKFEGLTVDGVVPLGGGGKKALLLKPMTYMNLSGRSVQAALAFYQLTPADLLVVLDDVALPCGKLRLRAGGSSGGHNGLKDIERALGTSQYPRLRIGVDPPPPRVPQRDWVLGKFGPEQRTLVQTAVSRACDAIAVWMEKGIVKAMSDFNADESEKERKHEARDSVRRAGAAGQSETNPKDQRRNDPNKGQKPSPF